eukprot:GHVQ01031161.1.p1 GENE.GHVQ01031161.1~~GHVQ01031161.1.p1  ORF type:complete len:1460 (+),score=160.49 GHVQ01031161.1:1695-6074(+)
MFNTCDVRPRIGSQEGRANEQDMRGSRGYDRRRQRGYSMRTDEETMATGQRGDEVIGENRGEAVTIGNCSGPRVVEIQLLGANLPNQPAKVLAIYDTGAGISLFEEELCVSLRWAFVGKFEGTIKGIDGSAVKHMRARVVMGRFITAQGNVVELPVISAPLVLQEMSSSMVGSVVKGVPQAIVGCDVLSELQPEGISTAWGPITFNKRAEVEASGKGSSGGQYMTYSIYTGMVEIRTTHLGRWQEFAHALGSEHDVTDDGPQMMSYTFSTMRTNSKTGRREARLPWRGSDKSHIGSNVGLAVGRLKSFVRQHPPGSDKFEAMRKQVAEWEDLGFIEDVPTGQAVGYAVPLSVVVTADGRKVTSRRAKFVTGDMKIKNRIVADFSAKSGEHVSVNEELSKGLGMLHHIGPMIMEARMGAQLVSADIEKAYPQVGIVSEDRRFLIFVWLKEPDRGVCPGNICIMQFKRCPFGLVCGGFILATALCHIGRYVVPRSLQSQSEEVMLGTGMLEERGPREVKNMKEVLRGTYVDNVFKCTHDSKVAAEFCTMATRLLKEGGMRLCHWASNNVSNLQGVPESDQHQGGVVNLLGMTWNVQSDTLQIKPMFGITPQASYTKREVLSGLVSCFDPSGFVLPIVMRARIIYREVCESLKQWDDVLTRALVDRWTVALIDLMKVHTFTFLRYEGGEEGYSGGQIAVFTDAATSTNATAAVAYWVRKDNTTFLAAKGSVKGKELTTPKLELEGVMLGSRLLRDVRKATGIRVDQCTIWTDSQVVLQQVRSNNSKDKFVQTRVTKLGKESGGVTMRFVGTTDNPADLPSRGATFDRYVVWKQRWLQGPQWLQQNGQGAPSMTGSLPAMRAVTIRNTAERVQAIPTREVEEAAEIEEGEQHETEQQWVYANVIHEEVEECPGQREQSAVTPTPEDRLTPLERLVSLLRRDRMKTLRQLWRCTAAIVKLATKRGRETSRVQLIKDAEDMWIRITQVEDNVRAHKECARLFRDDKGIWRCKTRITAIEEYEVAHPVYLPGKSWLAEKLVDNEHFEGGFHQYAQAIIANIRMKYRITGLRKMAQKVVSKCVVCRSYQGGPYKAPDPPPLPSYRVARGQPAFAACGIDVIGPHLLRSPSRMNARQCRIQEEDQGEGDLEEGGVSEGEGYEREGQATGRAQRGGGMAVPRSVEGRGQHVVYWVLLITCAVTRAVHLELLRCLDSKEILWALRRFVAVRGKPSMMVSDNAKQFQLLGKITGQLQRAISIDRYMLDNGIEWKTIPALSPWMGGFYERLVGLTKKAMHKGLWCKRVSIRELEVVVAEVMCFLNNRPLTVVSSEAEPLRPIRPADFLKVGGISGVWGPQGGEGVEQAESVIGRRLVRAWQRSHGYAEAIWGHWYKRYLLELRDYHLKRKGKRVAAVRPEVGDVVLVDDLPPIPRSRDTWRLGVVIKLHKSASDGEVRSVDIRSRGQVMVRP